MLKIMKYGSNHVVIHLNNDTEILFSYTTPVAGYTKELGWFRTDKKWSKTTSKHINQYLEGLTTVKKIPQEQIDNLIK